MARPETSLRHGALLLLYTVSAFLLLMTLMGASKQIYQVVQPRPQAHGGMLATSIMAPSKRGPAAGSVSSWQPAIAALDTEEIPLPVRLSLLPAARLFDCFQRGVEGVSGKASNTQCTAGFGLGA